MGLFYKGYKLKNTQNLNLSLYDGYDLMYITRQSDSLNSNMKLIDGAIKDLKEDTSNTKEELDYYKMSNDATTQALSNRIDSLVVSAGDSSAEVLNARVSSDGKTYTSLRDRLDTEYNTLTLNKANTSDLNVESERIDNLETTKANISDLTAESLRITSLESSKADVDALNAESARINKLELNKVDTSALENESTRLSDLISKKANKSDLSAESLRIDSLEDNSVTKQQLKTESERLGSLITGKADSSSLDAESSRIDNLESSKADVTELNKATTRISSLESNKADITSLNAESARIDKLITDKADIDLLNTESARIDNLETTKANISDLNTETARIEELVATKASIEDLNTESARIDTLESNTVTTETLNAEKARIDALETGKADISVLTAESARIDSLETNKLSIKDFETDKARIDALEANKADITSLNAGIARIDTLETGKADIDLANVNNAWISNGVIKDASIANEKVISVSANKLTAGTIDASKITVTNLNADNITVGTINGARIGNSSIDLDKLSQEVPTKEYLDSVEKKLQEEIDGAIETFTVSEIPTLNNEPAVNWTTDDIKSTHVGDLCYVVNNANDNDGFCYRFQYNGTAYSWALIKDNDVTKAIKDIAELGGEVTQLKTDYTSKVSEIDGGIESLKSRTTTIETTYSTKTYAENKANEALTSANSYSDGKASSTLSSAKTYTDNTATSTLTSANTYSDNKASDALTSANSYADNKASSTLTSAKSYTDSTASSTLGEAKSYTDTATADMATTGDIPTKVSELTNDSSFATTTQVSTAKSEAISTASADATSKANSALDSAKSYTDAVEIGGRNLFLNTGEAVSSSEYLITYYKYANEPLEAGETYTATICVTPAENVSEIGVFFSQGYWRPARFWITETSKQIISKTFTMGYYKGMTPDVDVKNAYVQLYRFPNDGTVTGNTTIHWFKIEKGNRATDWTPAPEDVDASISDAQTAADNAQTTADEAKTKAEAAQTAVSTKVETSVFNTLKNTVDENSANITSLTETVTTKADSSTVTTLSNTVNEVKQTADENSSSISSLTTTVNSKADGSKVTELETKASTIEQNLNGVTTKVTKLESTSKGLDTRLTAAEANITVTSDAITSKVSKDEIISAINQTAESISIDAGKINLNGAVTFTSFDSSLQTTINNKAETSDLEAVRTTADEASANALSAQETTDALDDDLTQFKANEYSQVNEKVGELVIYKGDNEEAIANIKDELSQELVAKKFARIENGSLILGKTNDTTAILTNEQFGFYTPNSEVPASYFGKDGDVWAFNIERGIVTNDLRFNGFQWISRANKNMSLKWLK